MFSSIGKLGWEEASAELCKVVRKSSLEKLATVKREGGSHGPSDKQRHQRGEQE